MASTKRLSAVITIGGVINGAFRNALSGTTKGLDRIGQTINKLTERQRELNRTIKEQERLGARGSALAVGYAQQELAAINKQITALRSKQALLQRIEGAREANLARRSELRGQIFDAVAIGAAAAAPINAARNFETAMLGVAKQLDGARDEAGKLTPRYFEMAAAIKKLGHELPIPTNGIADMVAAGLRMGVAADEVLDFVRASAMMSTAFELPEGELAESMGKIAKLYKIPIPAIGELADTINYLDDNAISKGGDIINYLQRVGGVVGAVKITGKEVAALGSTLLTLGERTETAGTATNAIIQKLAAAEKGTKKFRSAIRELGLNVSDIQKGMQTDAMGTLLKVLEAANKLPEDARLGVLTELVGLEHSDTLAKLATNTAELRHQLELANSEAAKGSMMREFLARMATTDAQLQITKNRVNELAVNIGSVLLPAFNSTLTVVGRVATAFAQFAERHPTLVKAVVGVGTALVSLRLAALGAAYAFTFIKGGALVLAGAATKLVTALRLVGATMLFISRAMLLNPIGLVITALITGATLLIQHWEPARVWWNNFIDGITAKFGAFADWFSSKIDWIGEKWGAVKSFFGFGDDAPAPKKAPAAASALPTPALATGRGAAAVVTDNSQVTFNITQLPGENAEQLAKRVAEEMERQRQVRARSRAYDEATP